MIMIHFLRRFRGISKNKDARDAEIVKKHKGREETNLRALCASLRLLRPVLKASIEIIPYPTFQLTLNLIHDATNNRIILRRSFLRAIDQLPVGICQCSNIACIGSELTCPEVLAIIIVRPQAAIVSITHDHLHESFRTHGSFCSRDGRIHFCIFLYDGIGAINGFFHYHVFRYSPCGIIVNASAHVDAAETYINDLVGADIAIAGFHWGEIPYKTIVVVFLKVPENIIIEPAIAAVE